MKTLIVFVLLTTVGHSQIQTDKVAHFGIGYAIGATTTALTSKQKPIVSISAGFLAGTLVGVGKEIYDKQGHGTPSFKDALWTSIGSGLGSVTIRVGINQYQRR